MKNLRKARWGEGLPTHPYGDNLDMQHRYMIKHGLKYSEDAANEALKARYDAGQEPGYETVEHAEEDRLSGNMIAWCVIAGVAIISAIGEWYVGFIEVSSWHWWFVRIVTGIAVIAALCGAMYQWLLFDHRAK